MEIFGFLIGIGIASFISAAFMRLSVWLISRKKVPFGRAFGISFVAVLAALLVQVLLGRAADQNSIAAAAPGLVFFLACWLLNGMLVDYGELPGSHSFGKAFLVTLIQSAAWFITVMILVLGFMAVIGVIGPPPR